MIKQFFDMIAGMFRATPGEHWDMIKHDLRYAVRMMRKNLGFTAIAIVTLALGVGVNTAIFSILNGIILRPLPFKQPGRIVILRQQLARTGIDRMDFSVQEMNDYRQQMRTMEGLVEYHQMRFVQQGDKAQRLRTGVVSHDFFDFFGIQPVLGRLFVQSDEQPGAQPTILLSHDFWQRSFGADRGVLGKTIRLNDQEHTIIGVLPPLPQYPDENDIYMTTTSCQARMAPVQFTNRNLRFARVFSRLKPGVTVQQADDDMAVIASRFLKEFPASYNPETGFRAFVLPLQQELTKKARPVLWVLLAAAGFVLLIACANVANFTLARLSHREQEFTLRTALGANQGRLLRQLLTESLLMGVTAAVLGLVLAYSSHRLLVEFVARFTPRARDITIDGWVLLFAMAAAILTSAITGSLLGFSSKYQNGSALKEAGRQSTTGAGQKRVRNTLIVAQVAFSLVLLIGAGLMLRSFMNMQQVNPGFSGEKVLTMALNFGDSKYVTQKDEVNAGHAILDKVLALPGVTDAAISSSFPLDPDAIAASVNSVARSTSRIQIEGKPVRPGEPLPLVPYKLASPDYFKTLGIPLVEGRTFLPSDKTGSLGVTVVNQSFARHYFGQESALDKRLSWDGGKTWLTIVGVVGNTKEFRLDEKQSDEIYYSIDQIPGVASLLVRTATDPLTLASQVRTVINETAPQTAITYLMSLEQARNDTLQAPRVMTSLLGLFAALALIVAASGIGGILALSVSQRLKEIGVRMALGARPSDVLNMVVRQGMVLVVFGLAAGAIVAFSLVGPLRSFLFQVAPTDPFTLGGVCILLAITALVACYIPARRATRINPIVALREQ